MIKLNVWERGEGKTNTILKYCYDNPQKKIGLISMGNLETRGLPNVSKIGDIYRHYGSYFDIIFIDETDVFDNRLPNLKSITKIIEIYRTVNSPMPFYLLNYYRTEFERDTDIYKVYNEIYSNKDYFLFNTDITQHIILNPFVNLVEYSEKFKYFNGIP